MSQQVYRANLTAAEFPLLSEFQGRNIISMGIDQNYSRQASSPKNKDRDIGIPQVYYAHNVIATDAGISSVGYQVLAVPPPDTDGGFDEVFTIRDSNDNVGFFANTPSGRCYVLASLTAGWVRTTDKAPLAGMGVSVAFVNGESYIFFGGVGCFKYNFVTQVLDAVPLLGLALATTMGITASSGYMIAWSFNKVFWSSNISPTDFLPSLVTGAGSQSLQQSRGSIVACIPQTSGFIVYTKKNAVAALNTNNLQAPFTFKENIGCGGLSAATLVAYDGNSTNHYAYTTAGLQEISMTSANVVLPQVTDFIAGSQFEDFNEATFTFTSLLLASPMKKKLAIISSRYLILSYGVNSLTHALIYDTALARMGKLKISHTDCFEFTYPSTEVVEAPRRSIAFVQADGTVQVVTMSYNTTGSTGVAIMGKYQMVRGRYLTMQEAHLDSIREDSSLSVRWLSSIDGTNTEVIPATLASAIGTYRRYNSLATGLNHSLVVIGGFNLNSLVLKFSDAGAVT